MNILQYFGSGERIDKRLPSKFPYSRSFFNHIISRGGILVGDKIVKKSYNLKNGDKVSIDDLQRYLSPVVLEEAPKIDLEIKLEKEDYLVLYKPKGVLSHPNSVRDISNPSVVGFLYHHYKNLPSIGNFIRSGLIHRLDKETDGLMIIVKTEKGLDYFKKLFQKKSEAKTIIEKEKVKLKKYYRANSYITDKGRDFLVKIKNNLPFVIEEEVVPKVPYYIPKIGITKILDIQNNTKIDKKILKKDEEIVQLKIEILTGRTHQIRYHLSIYGLPIIGDYVYGVEEKNINIQLTAYKLEFLDNNGDFISLEI